MLPPLGMPLSAGSSQSEPARQVLPAAGRSWPEAAVCTAEWVSLKLMTRVIITVLPTPALSPHLTRSATLACLLARSASPSRDHGEIGTNHDRYIVKKKKGEAAASLMLIRTQRREVVGDTVRGHQHAGGEAIEAVHRQRLHRTVGPRAAREVVRHRRAEAHEHARIATGQPARGERGAVDLVLVGEQHARAFAPQVPQLLAGHAMPQVVHMGGIPLERDFATLLPAGTYDYSYVARATTPGPSAAMAESTAASTPKLTSAMPLAT